MPDPRQQARQLFAQEFNCGQSVAAAYADRMGIAQADILKLCAGFGGGIAGQQLTCGAVLGATMVIAYYKSSPKPDNQDAKDRTKACVLKFYEQFKQQHGSVSCRELLGTDINKLTEAERAGVFEHCPKYVESAMVLLEDIIK